ncbi:DoxX family membrane protein [Flavobacteriaceae bacterium Ap0902]|nr:DoxX family membrane protein [Flavobacteriaceae bacterium Ap0902]
MKKEINIDLGLLILRIAIGGLMLFHGLDKAQAPAETINHMAEVMRESNLPGFLAYGVFLGELIAPLLILFGFRTKLFSSLIVITMIVAIITRHFNDIFTLGGSGGWGIELQALYLLGALALTFTGAGRIAVSHKSKWD